MALRVGNNTFRLYGPQNVRKLQSSCGEFKNQIKNNEAYTRFGDGISDNLKETIEANYKRVKQEVLSLVDSEIERIKNYPNLKGLIKE